jgi:hypothetical protein
MESIPTYENYCRERKATLDKERSLEHSRSMSEVVDDILEIISTDEDVLKKTKRETILTSQSSYAKWSLSSSAIITSWPSISLVDDDDDGVDMFQKSIQSYTSQLFSPLYEVRPDQHNVFQENRQPLPKPGYTPKVRNLCYNLGTDLSYEQADEYSIESDYRVKNKYSSSVPSSKNKRIHSTTERILLDVNPLVAMTNTDVQARDMKADTPVDHRSPSSRQLLYNHDDNIELDNMTPSQTGREADEAFNDVQITHFTLTNDNFYARNDWMLKTYSSADSGELSLEPLLNAYSEEFNLDESHTCEPHITDLTDKKVDEEINKLERKNVQTHSTINVQPTAKLHSSSTGEESRKNQTAASSTEMVKCDETHDLLQLISVQQAIENVQIKNYALLRNITIEIPLTPSLLYAIDTSLIALQSMISKSLVGYSVLVRLDKKKIAMREHSEDSSSPKDLSMILEHHSSQNNDDGCFLLDLDTCCTPNSDMMNRIDKEWIYVGGKSHPDGNESNRPEESPTHNGRLVHHLKVLSLPDVNEAFILDSEGLETPSHNMPQISSSSQSETNAKDIVDNFIHSIDCELNERFDIDADDESVHFSSDAAPASFDSEQFLKDMALRIESELSNYDGTLNEDDGSTSTIFQRLSSNFLSASCESNDGLDEEICALEMFEVDLKNEIAKANDSSVLASLISPMHTLLSSQSSTCSMTTTFLSGRNGLSCQSSDEGLDTVTTPYARKVHFNEQVEEFLYLANEACGTPDANASERQKNDETFMDEICNVFDDILDELSYACVSISRAMDRTYLLSKKKEIRRSSVC